MSFSREFIHPGHGNPYDILQVCPSSGNVVCRTSFARHRVRQYLDDWPTANEFKVIEVKLSGKYYFALLALENGSPKDDPLVGDLPCPNECLPPPLRGNTSFDAGHISNVIDTSNCKWLQVQRSRVSGQIDYVDFSIYALTDDGHGGYIEEDDPGDEMYTTIN